MQQLMICCPICRGSVRDISHVCQHPDFTGSDIYRCLECQHYFTYPEPNNDTLAIYYRDTYSNQRRQYFGEPYYVLMERRAKAQIQFIKQNLQPKEQITGLRNFKALDIGCGVGALTAYLHHQEGADSTGYDSDGKAIEVGRKRWKNNMGIQANLSINPSDGLIGLHGQFDLLSLSHLVEHLPDVSLSVTSIIQTLRPGGYVFVEVPNCFSEMFLAKVDTESHLHFFSQRSLQLLLESTKLNVISCQNCGPPKFQAYNLGRQSPRLVKQFRAKMAACSRVVFGQTMRIRTIYDGYYDHYPVNDNGLWLRCLAQKNSTRSREIC